MEDRLFRIQKIAAFGGGVKSLTAKYDLMPLLGNAGLQVWTPAFGTKQPVPFGLDTRMGAALRLATEITARQVTARLHRFRHGCRPTDGAGLRAARRQSYRIGGGSDSCATLDDIYAV